MSLYKLPIKEFPLSEIASFGTPLDPVHESFAALHRGGRGHGVGLTPAAGTAEDGEEELLAV